MNPNAIIIQIILYQKCVKRPKEAANLLEVLFILTSDEIFHIVLVIGAREPALLVNFSARKYKINREVEMQ